MSRSHRDLDNSEKADANALARMLRCGTSPADKHDGRDLVMQALDDADLRKSIAQQMHGGVQEGQVDEAALGKTVSDAILAYCRACPRFEDLYEAELADLSERDTEQEDRDDELERDDALTHS